MAKPANHIVFLCSRLDLPGGIERAIVSTANLFAGKGYRITLVVLDTTSKSFYPVSSQITVIQKPLSFGITKQGNIITRKLRMLSDVLQLRRLLKKIEPSRVIATEYPFATAAVLTGVRKRSPLFSWEHHHFYELKKNRFWDRMFRFTYPKLDSVICLNADEKKLFGTVNSNPVVIPNFVEPGSPASLTNRRILTIARLTHVKGTDLLLQTAGLLLKKHPSWQWKLIGEGDMKEEVERFVYKENLEGRLILQPPVHHDIIGEYREASLYVMTSRYECFPMTLLEAQSVGLPCLAFDCDTGPRHIIRQNQDGMLTEKENPAKLAEAIGLLIQDEEKRKMMGRNAIESAKKFSPEATRKIWEEVLKI